ncbi:MAG: DUF411 domain-containing protein [Gemmatimonadaceae bacterium]
MNRRDWLQLAFASAATTAFTRGGARTRVATKITVYKSPTCGCCANWVAYMKKNGFTVDAHDTDEAMLEQVKATAGVPAPLRSCHVALANGYAFEGHVPADLVKKVLAERPKILGLAVPGMPAGSPGMEMGPRHESYEVMSFSGSGVAVYAKR